MKLLLSGATGTLGVPLVQSLLTAHPELRIHAVLRSERAWLALQETLPPTLQARVRPLRVDLSDAANVAALAEVLHATERDSAPMTGLHLAADVSWDKPCEDMVQVNVEGSRNFCRLLCALSSQPRMLYVSTAYTRMHDWPYRNGYEESKALAERTIRAAFGSHMPMATFSCSLVVGDSRDGQIARFNGLYPLIKFLALFHPPFLVGHRDGLLDIVPVDWVVRELAALVEDLHAGRAPDEVVAAAGATRIRYEAVVRLIEARLSHHRAQHGLPPVPEVPILRDRQWSFLKRSLAAWQPPGLSSGDFRYFERLLQVYGTYASSDRVRAPLNVRTPAPDPQDFLGRTVDYWISRHPRALRARGVGATDVVGEAA
ncbi:SDR family oxidoreductase [Roseateles sp. SL47]|uniref:SDR family oxidoreductase n=1 Tax=Roseateles sp. SL47 TaxID=2995138 RepID=UPI00227149C2|nr:SDR family oxidoreductase [Roseateles sp. SL47]WAC71669.1 SDR family oxidoreductase [Roseateles sp. SL47]